MLYSKSWDHAGLQKFKFNVSMLVYGDAIVACSVLFSRLCTLRLCARLHLWCMLSFAASDIHQGIKVRLGGRNMHMD